MKKEKVIKVNLTNEEASSIIFTDEKVAKKVTLEGKEYECFESQTILKLPEGVAKSLLRELKLNIARN